jgi:hypothetical protein
VDKRVSATIIALALGAGALALPSITDAGTSAKVPFVGCPADGQTGPVDAPTQDPVPVQVDAKTAGQLAYYKGANGAGVFAPRGWHCRQWYGSNGAFVIVTPDVPTDEIPPRSILGPGVELIERNGETSGRFEVAQISARFFPAQMHDFIRQVRDEKLVPDSTFAVKPYPMDSQKTVGDGIVEFSTPASLIGFGTEGGFRPSSAPVEGLVALDPPARDIGLSVLRVRLSTARHALSASIIQIEEKCIQRTDGC